MDICLVPNQNGFLIQPNTILGMLWLQTHFEEEHWAEIASNKVRTTPNNAEILFKDACDAGLNLKYLSTESLSNNF